MTNLLFAPNEPHAMGWLAVGDGHQIHWQTSGRADKPPVLWIHGGPGSASIPLHRQFLDPDRHWIIQFDQRGCGKSRPQSATVANQTQDLIADIERLREHLAVPCWTVVGGSWGATLALLYAMQHPAAVGELVLRSLFLASQAEIDAFLSPAVAGCDRHWATVADLLSVDGPAAALDALQRVFCGTTDNAHAAAVAQALARHEACLDAWPNLSAASAGGHAARLLARYRVMFHYLAHGCFLTRPLLEGLADLSDIPITLVHGDHDALCPIRNSEQIQATLPNSRLFRVAGTGHSLSDSRMVDALATCLRALKAA